MSLSAGTRLGPYEILEPLGAGGGRSMMTVTVRHGPTLSLGRSTDAATRPRRAWP